ncbi:hypothetical protein ACH4VR_31565 [Streptomyces sp. NPDC020883]|uniref:hypothetical protein n=1 Tax=Streptomyces sp. NPDC020883 TaxID=3365099 RepID=UPI003795A651
MRRQFPDPRGGRLPASFRTALFVHAMAAAIRTGIGAQPNRWKVPPRTGRVSPSSMARMLPVQS